MKRFILIGALPSAIPLSEGSVSRGVSVDRLLLVGSADTDKEIAALAEKKYTECGGLLLVIDLLSSSYPKPSVVR